MNITTTENLPLSPQLFAGNRTAVMGVSGTGKTNTVAVLIEELAPHMPIYIVDPEGEMWTLRERIPNLLIVGNSENADVLIQPHQAEAVAVHAVENGLSVILDLFDYESEDDIEATAEGFARGLFNACKQKRTPHLLVVEEAHMFFPQPMKRGSAWAQIARRGRKFGIGMILATQRSQNVDKDILTQCQIRILHSVTHPRDVSVYKDLVPMTTKAVDAAINKLDIGEAIVVYPDAGMQINPRVKIRLRETHHAGATPQIDGGETIDVQIKPAQDEQLDRLKAIVNDMQRPKIDPAITERDKRIRELEEEKEMNDGIIRDLNATLEKQERLIFRLNERIEMLKLIEVAPITINVQMAAGEYVTAQAVTTPRPKPKVNHAIHQQTLFEYKPDVPALDEQRNQQQLALRNLIRELLNLPTQEQRIVRHLAERPSEQFRMEDIARSMGYALSTLANNHPAGLCHWEILKRWKVGRKWCYQSNLAAHVQEIAPDLDVEESVQTVIRALPD